MYQQLVHVRQFKFTNTKLPPVVPQVVRTQHNVGVASTEKLLTLLPQALPLAFLPQYFYFGCMFVVRNLGILGDRSCSSWLSSLLIMALSLCLVGLFILPVGLLTFLLQKLAIRKSWKFQSFRVMARLKVLGFPGLLWHRDITSEGLKSVSKNVEVAPLHFSDYWWWSGAEIEMQWETISNKAVAPIGGVTICALSQA